MREMGLAALARDPNLSKRAQKAALYPYLLRDVTAAHPNHVWGSEEVYLHEYATPCDARRGLSHYLEFYNQERLHQALDYRTPAEVYATLPAPVTG